MRLLEIIIFYWVLDEAMALEEEEEIRKSPEYKVAQQHMDRKTPRISIRRYTESSFLFIFNSGNEQALLNCFEVDHMRFKELLDMTRSSLMCPVF